MRLATHRTRGPAAVLSIALVAVLVGCAPAVQSQPSVSAPPTGTATATAEPQSDTPTPLLGGDCSKLVSMADVVSATAVSTVALAPPQPRNDLYLLPIPQAGGLECDWHDDGSTTDLDVAVIPNARAALDAQTTRLDAGDDGKDAAQIANVPAYGDQSWTHCYSLGEDPSDGCMFDIRVGTFWVEVNQVYGGRFTAYPQAPGVSAMLSDLVHTVRSLATVRAWKPDVRGLRLPTTCAAALPQETVRSATGGADLTYADGGTFNPLLDGAFASTGSLFCQWLSKTDAADVAQLQFVVVPGSTWAWSSTAAPPITLIDGPLTAQAGLGSAAYGTCQTTNLSSECELFVLAHHTWFEVKQDNGPTRPATMSAVTSLARRYLTTIGFAS
jgi:hypothetical protein